MERHIARKKVKEVMTKEVVTVTSSTDLKQLKEMFEKYDFNSFPVVDGQDLVGVVSKLDLLKAFTSGVNVNVGRFMMLYSKTAGDIMHAANVYVSPEDDISTAADFMVEFNLRSLPVLEKGKLKGMLSRQDVIRCLMIE
ncbi:MAG: CBS domain-containing protein [Methanomassiliicoccales archaeon]|nr:CBS domain-containing protein [Methanomassiliicoccales archaeon]